MKDPGKIYRLYIDESGNHSYGSTDSIQGRYLALCGVILSQFQNETSLIPKFEEMRSMFTDDVDDQPTFHYTDLISQKGRFSKLKDESVRASFNGVYIEFLENSEFTVCCIVIDKKTHKERYGQPMHPYHYCLNLLLERYVQFLGRVDGRGDVMAEGRGGKEDQLLKSEYQHFFNNGTSYIDSSKVQLRLSSKEIKIKTKEARVAGLELADLLATPLKFLTLFQNKIINKLDNNFSLQVLKIVWSKIRSGPSGRKNGYGLKLIK